MSVLLAVALVLLLVTSSCKSDGEDSILVFTAASLADVMEELGQEFTKREGIEVSFNLGGSTELAQLIVRGAPADLFLSADSQPMLRLEERNLILPDSRVDLLSNKLVLVGSLRLAEADEIDSVEDLAGSDKKVAIAAPDLAPAGWYAREALMNLGLWEQVEPRTVPAPNVRVAMSYVETGNVDVGIVYYTDVQISKDLEILASIPSDVHPPIVYPAIIVESSPNLNSARRFLSFLTGDTAQETFRRYGFIPHNSR